MGLFVLQKEEDDVFFDLLAAYAYNRAKFIQKRISADEGLVGRVYVEKELVYLDEIPDNYISVGSGLGDTEPSILLLLPLLNEENEVQGVIELTTFKPFEEYELDFLKKLAESIASTITITLASQNNQVLLESAQANTHKLEIQEKIFKRNAKKMEDMQRKTNKRLTRLEKTLQQLNTIISEIPEALIMINQQGKISRFNRYAEYLFGYQSKEVLNQHINMLISEESNFYYEHYFADEEESQERLSILETLNKQGETFSIQLSLSRVSLDNKYWLLILAKKIV